MFLLATLFTLFSVVQGYSITTPSGWSNGQKVAVAWTSVPSDPQTFSIELNNPTLLNNHAFAIATTLNKGDGAYAFDLPAVPAGDGYTLQFVNVSDINNVYATSGSFSISNTTASSTTSSGSASTASATANTTNGTVTGTVTGTASTSDASSAQSATQTGSANKVGAAASLAIALAALRFSILDF